MSDSRTEGGVGHTEGIERHAALQLLAFGAGPAAVLLSMQAKAIAVPWACAHHNMLVSHAAALAGALIALAAGALAHREWRRAGGGWPNDEGGERGRSRFLSALAQLLAA
ncbi:MAG TPA: hypothetical protein VFO94_18635, partial [Gammaproteobacteria bacterium]|nr:hypothetical protein [Gammaproteobacteria bacterium]